MSGAAPILKASSRVSVITRSRRCPGSSAGSLKATRLFLDLDDRLGISQPLFEPLVLMPQPLVLLQQLLARLALLASLLGSPILLPS